MKIDKLPEAGFPHRAHRSKKNKKRYSCHKSLSIKEKLLDIKAEELTSDVDKPLDTILG